MRGPLSDDDLEELEFSVRTSDGHRQAAATLLAWAGDEHPEDDVPPARLVNAAAWHLEQGGDDDAALDLYRRSVAARGDVLPDKRCYLHGALLKAGLHEEAHRLAEEIRRSAPSDPDVYSFMCENHELAGDLRQAHRWLTMGARRLELSDEEDMPPGSESSELVLLRTRRRVRQELGFPPDDLDELVPPIGPEDGQ